MMEASGDKPDRKPSRRDMKMASKSSSLPPGAVLMAHPGDGFFTKIRRCLRLRSKGKYDFNHSRPSSEADSEGTLAYRNKSSNSPVKGHNDAAKLSVRTSPQKSSQRAKSDKEEVVLVHNKKSSSGIKVVSKNLDGKAVDVLVVTVGGKVETVAGATADCTGTENKENDEIFEDIDPDYETLDDIQRKMRSQGIRSETALIDVPAADQTRMACRQPLQDKIKPNYDFNGQDSGLGSPFTESPSSSRESQGHSVTSSGLSSSVVSSSISESLKESAPNTSSVVIVNDIPPSTSDTDPLLISCTSLNGSNSALEEEDLYSNAKVLIRKKSQRQSQSTLSLSVPDQQSSGLSLEEPRSARNSLSPAHFLALMEAENQEPVVPPPLPARNYSEEDISTHVENNDSPQVGSAVSVVTLTGCETSNETGSETLCNITDTDCDASEQSALTEHGPVAIMDSERDSTFPMNGTYEDIPEKQDTKHLVHQTSLNCGEKTVDDELMFIDDDLSADGDCHTDKTNLSADGDCPTDKTDSSDLPEDIMIVSASDSLCGNDTDDSQGCVQNETKLQSSEMAQPSEAGLPDTLPESAETAALVTDLEQELDDSNCENLTEDMPKSDSCSNSNVKGEDAPLSETQNTATPAASASHHFSVSSSSSSTSPPLSSSSSDTLNLVDEPDPDDLEGNDFSPVGPPIHISHQQLLRHMDARSRGDELSPAPVHQLGCGSGSSVARNARSMEIPPCHFIEHEDEQGACGSTRRHSSSVAASSTHRDFIESMKQLKDCGWYWGPLSYEEAENKLNDKCDGSFLVRDSSNENYILSLSFKSMGKVHHTRIEHHKGLFSFWSQPDSHGKARICQFIEQTVENSKNGRFLYFLRPAGPGSPPLPIQLLYPVSRFFRVPSLQHMCRFLVLRRVRRDHIDSLPLPQKVKGYLLEKQYYVETLEED